MSEFTCELDANLPAEVRAGAKAEATVTVRRTSEPIESVVLSLDAYNVRQPLKRVDESTFQMTLRLPPFTPRGTYQLSLWAISTSGHKSSPTAFQVRVR